MRVQRSRHLRCAIQCNGKILQEYRDGDAQDTRKTATRYVQATTGAEFNILIGTTIGVFRWQDISLVVEGMCQRICKSLASNLTQLPLMESVVPL